MSISALRPAPHPVFYQNGPPPASVSQVDVVDSIWLNTFQEGLGNAQRFWLYLQGSFKWCVSSGFEEEASHRLRRIYAVSTLVRWELTKSRIWTQSAGSTAPFSKDAACMGHRKERDSWSPSSSCTPGSCAVLFPRTPAPRWPSCLIQLDSNPPLKEVGSLGSLYFYPCSCKV